MDISDILTELTKLAGNHKSKSILFNFIFNGLEVRGVFFAVPLMLTIGVSDKNVAWQTPILPNGRLLEHIPNEAYRLISSHLSNEGKYSNKPFFNELHNCLQSLILKNEPKFPSDNYVLELLSQCVTEDKQFDAKDGDKPFFGHWARTKPSAHKLNKIQRYFGHEVRQSCYCNNITAHFFPKPKNKTLSFLKPGQALFDIKERLEKD